MKKQIIIAALMAAGLVQAGVVQMGSTWHTDNDGVTLSGSSASGFNALMSTAGNQNNYAYQSAAGGDFSAMTFNVGDTLNLSFTATVDSTTALNGGDRILRFGVFDEVTGNGLGAAVDYGNLGGTKLAAGVRTGISVGNAVFASDVSSGGAVPNGLSGKGASSDFSVSLTRTGVDDYDITFNYGGLEVSGSSVDSVEFSSINAFTIGVRQDAVNEYELSNFSMEVVPEPATLGLIAMASAGLMAVRRFNVI